MRTVFMGNPDFALPSLQRLHQSEHQVVAVVTGPDKPAGRGRRILPTPVKRLAEQLGYPVLQPPRLKDPDFIGYLRDLSADIFVVVAFRILPDILLEIPPRGAVNLHPSLLPRYRGAAPIQHTLLAGEQVTGVTTIRLTSRVDAGGIFLQQQHPIHPEDDFGSLSERLAQAGAELLAETLNGIEQGTLEFRPQETSGSEDHPSAPKIRPENLVIDWALPARTIANRIRAFSPRPGAYTLLNGTRLKLFHPAVTGGGGQPGRILGTEQGRLRIETGNGILEVGEVQLEGRRRMTVTDFLRGRPLETGTILGR